MDKFIHFSSLKQHQETLFAWTNHHYWLSVCVYTLTFSLLIACTVPCATLLTLLGGMLFSWPAILYAEIGTTLGGFILFHAVRTAFGAHLAKPRSSNWIKRMEAGFRNNAFNYLLMLRLMPIFPCWISNIGAGALNVPQKTFLAATTIGILPVTVIYVMAGRGLNLLLSTDQPITASTVLHPAIILPLIGLALLSLMPILYKQVKQRHKKEKERQ